MDRPDLGKPVFEPANFRCIGRTQNLEEANRLAEQYQLQGYQTQIIKRMQGSLAIYEVWVGKERDSFQAPK